MTAPTVPVFSISPSLSASAASSLRAFLIPALALLLAACAAPAPVPRDGADRSDPTELARAGRHAEAAEAWLALAEREPQQAGTARLRAAEAWLEAGEPQRAQDLVDALDPTALERPGRLRLDLLRAELALNRGEFDRAERILAIAADELPPELRERRVELRGRLAVADPDSPRARMEALATAVEEPGFEPTLALALLIDVRLSDLDALIEAHGDDPRLGRWLRLGREVRRNLLDPAGLEQAIIAWHAEQPDVGTTTEDLIEWVEAWRSRQPFPSRVAVLLPGEGPLTAAGNALRDGMLAAWMQLPTDLRPALDFLYVAPDPDGAIGGWFAARERGAEFIIGPLDRAQIPALLALPDPGAPMLLLNRPPPDAVWPTPAQSLAILALPPEEEAELAAVRALVDGAARALVIAQQTDFGERLAGRFAETFELGGGRVVERLDYPPRESDVTDRLENALRLGASEARIDRIEALVAAPFEAEPQRRTDFDVIFLAARDEARQVQPQLRFVELGAVPALATSHVLTSDRDRDLDGLRLPVSPWLLAEGPAAEARRAAEQAFPELARSITLSQLHALGRDAVALLPWLEAMKRDPRLALAGTIGTLRLADGVALERDLPWAVIRDGVPQRP